MAGPQREEELKIRLDELLAEFSSSSVSQKVNSVGKELIKFLANNPDALNNYGEAGSFIEALATVWVNCSNPKVSQYGLEALILVAEGLQSKYMNYAESVLKHVVAKLGNTKEPVREKARSYLLKTVEVGAHDPNLLIENLMSVLRSQNKELSCEAHLTIRDILVKQQSKVSVSTLEELLQNELDAIKDYPHVRERAVEIIKDVSSSDLLGKSNVLSAIAKKMRGQKGPPTDMERLANLKEMIQNLNLEENNSQEPAKTPSKRTVDDEFWQERPKYGNLEARRKRNDGDEVDAEVEVLMFRTGSVESSLPNPIYPGKTNDEGKSPTSPTAVDRPTSRQGQAQTSRPGPRVPIRPNVPASGQGSGIPRSASPPRSGRTSPPRSLLQSGRTSPPRSLVQSGRTSPPRSLVQSGRTSPPRSLLSQQSGRTSPPRSILTQQSGRTSPPRTLLQGNRSASPPPRTTVPPPSAPKPKGKAAKAAAAMKASAGRGVSSSLAEGQIYALHSGPSGDADESWFMRAFEDVPEITCVNTREFDNLLKKTGDDLKSGTEYWERKVDGLRKIRAMVLHLSNYEEEVREFIKTFAISIQACLKDLRSQVVREACLTFAFICKELKNKLDGHSCELIMLQLMNNVMNSAKVISSASHVAMEFMFSNVTHGRLVTQLVQTLQNSRSQEVKTAACKLLDLILQRWPVHRLEQQIPTLQNGIKCGVGTGSVDGRMAARKAFWAFRSYFPDQGEALLASMDQAARKHLAADRAKHGEPELKDTKPTQAKKPAEFKKPRLVSQVPRPSPVQPPDPAPNRHYGVVKDACHPCLVTVRSSSLIDVHAVQRAKARQQYAALNRQQAGCVASLPRPVKKSEPGSGMMSGNLERTGRTRSRVAGVSQSQPSSRSGSPSSRLGYHTYHIPDSSGPMGYSTPRHSRGGTPRSQGASRETSPNRFGGSKSSLNTLLSNKRRTPSVSSSRPLSAQKLLAQSLEAENNDMVSLYDADSVDSTGHRVSPRKTSYRPFEDHSDDSDASSLCSERSFDSYRRTSDSYSWSGSQQRIYRDVWDTGIKDINEIIANCESIHWSDRKEGLVALQAWLQAGNTLNPTELKRITEMFTRMFMDSHTKVFSLFLDTLNELLQVHRSDLNNWLYILLTRLLNKMGGDLLGSIQNKIQRCLEVIRESFPTDLQMASVLRFLTDPTQTPNIRVKIAALNFITKLAAITDPSQAFPPPSPGASRDPVQAALHKMIGWTMGDSIKQGSDLRRASQEAILALFNLSTPQVTLRLANLPQEYQEAAATLLRCRVRRGSVGTGGSVGSPPSPSVRDYPRAGSPALQRSQRQTNPETEGTNPEDVYKSLKKTTAEIQNYTFETAGSEKPPDKDKTTSKDSGICQLAGIEALEEAMEDLNLKSSSSDNTTASARTSELTLNGTESDTFLKDRVVVEDQDFHKVLKALQDTPEAYEIEKRDIIIELNRLIAESSVTVLMENFRNILRALIHHLPPNTAFKEPKLRMLVLSTLAELTRKRPVAEGLKQFTELLILNVLAQSKDPCREVVRSADACAAVLATTLDPSNVIRTLNPIILTGEYPVCLSALKMLTKLIDFWGRNPVYEHTEAIMNGVLRAYDNQESTVRKSAVFCLVAMNTVIGEKELEPYFSKMSGSKQKLLQLYIRRAKHGSSSPPTSPGRQPPPS